ncbi:TetR/AcrR family transcriptional regulator [Vibrio hangzhouensis]|uniref:Transcriptional regulator, TetR family n=1 Tax=Vibrio hangzhouensis TaxID=462991 RepID=A0A1H5W433_9VIBR|nr:TetR/AcrR family transcriptional regulator [Vibrio hangzhouensis]SEF94098.1 transcriptional regulator, TetR family [Vibrio hangzhouensis]
MSQKRQLLIDTALELFYQNGINSIGINEVLSSSGVAKRTLYKHFKSKDELIFAALQQRHDAFVHWLEGKLSGSTSDQETIRRLFGALESWFENEEPDLGSFRGCFFINTSAEFSDLESEIFRFCHYHKQQVRHLINAHLSTENHALVDAICLMKEGAIVTAHLSGNGREVVAKCLAVLDTFEI